MNKKVTNVNRWKWLLAGVGLLAIWHSQRVHSLLPEHLNWEWVVGLFAVAAALWAKIRRIISWLTGWVIVTNMVDSSLISVVLGYLNSQTSQKRRRKLREVGYFNSDNWYVRSLQRTTRVCYRVLSGRSEVIWYKKRPIWFSTGEPDESSSFSFFRWSVNWSQLLKEATIWEDESKQRESDSSANRYEVYKIFGSMSHGGSDDDDSRPSKAGRSNSLDRQLQNVELLHFEKEDIGEPREQASLSNLSLNTELQDVVEEARFWRREEPWFKEKGIIWRRSFCFEGDPGTGKTSLSRGIAEDLDLPIYCPDLATMSNQDFFGAWETAAENAPCMMLIEDIDRVFQGQNNVSKSPLTYDCLLNCIDGAKRPDGILLVITTNHAESLDPAMLRPGRTDRVVQFKPIGMEGRVKIANRILDDMELATELANKYSTESPAVFQEVCVKLAIEQKFAARKRVS